MPDDQKTALPDKKDGAADTASATSVESTSDADAREKEIAQLKQERDEALKKAENEAALRKSHQAKVEEANRLMAEGRNATDDPLDAEIAELERAAATLAANNQYDPATNSLLGIKRREREQRQRDAEAEKRLQQARQDMDAVPEQYKSRTWALFMTGRFWSVADALQGAKGEEADELRKKLDERDTTDRKREEEIRARQDKAPGSPRGGGGGGSSGPTKMPLSEYIAKINALKAAGDHAGAAKLTREKDEAKIQLDYAS